MIWRATDYPNDGNLRHPADPKPWKDFGDLDPKFARERCNMSWDL